MGLLSELIVNGVRRGTSPVISRAIGGGISTALTGGGGGGGGNYAASGSTRSSGTATPTPDPANTLQGVDVNAVTAATAPGGAVDQIVGNVGANAVNGGTTVDAVDVNGERATQDPAIEPGSAVGDALGLSAPVNLSGVDVTAPRPAPPPTEDAVSPLVSGAQALTNIPGGLDLSQPEDIKPAPDPVGIEQVAMLAPFAALGLVPTGSGLPAAGEITPPGGGDGLPLGVKPTDIAAAGLLGAGLLGGTGGTGAAGDAIKELAASNKELAGRLGGVAEAGFQGNIGGKGLNSISRMVRKAQAAIRQRYATMGMSGSTAEQDDLNSAVESGVDLQFKIGQQMAQTGLNAVAALTGQSAQAYLSLLNAQTQKDTALGNALANFAAAVAR